MNSTSPPAISRLTLASLLFFVSVSVVLFTCTPALVVWMSRDWHFSEAAAGAIFAGAVIGNTAGSLLVGWRLRWVTARAKLVGASVVALAGYALAIQGGTPTAVGVELFLAGLGGGVLNGEAVRTLTYSRHPHRYLSFVALAQNLSAALLMGLVLPPIGGHWGIQGAFSFLAVLTIPCVFMSKALPLDDATRGAIGSGRGSPVGIAALLVSTLSYYVLIGVVWTFVGSLGAERGLANDDVDRIVGISNLLSLAVCLWAPRLEHSRRTRAWSIFSVAATMVGVVGLVASHTLVPFAVFFLLMNCGWTLYSIVAQCLFPSVDPAGRFAALTTGLLGVGYSIGSYGGGEYLVKHSASACFLGALVFGAIGGVVLLLVHQRGHQAEANAESATAAPELV